ncbi:hypothetical protein GE09DRAFT_1231605 [Coniochaeta sp. 2T2.1]|nr:hypothetical protein GE09DRAFT_1231605 [Coniochaeta sp. 2T2.1]
MCPIKPGCRYHNQGLSSQDALALYLFNNHDIHNHATAMANLIAALEVQQATVNDVNKKLEWERALKAEVDIDLDTVKAESKRLHDEVLQLRIQLAEARAARESYEQGYERGYADGLAQSSEREE